MKIVVTQGGFPLWDLSITNVMPNAPLDLTVPETVANAAPPSAPQTMSTKLANGVWHVTGGSHHSVVVEFADYMAVVEAPLDEARSLAVIAEAKKLVPNKPLRYVLTTHHHFDHSGGLRTYVAEGATVVTHQSNVPYFEKTLVAPATLSPDAQSKAAKMPTLQGVTGKDILTDGKQTIEIYATGGDTHTNEYTLIYLPGPKNTHRSRCVQPGAARCAGTGDPSAQRGRALRRSTEVEIESGDHRTDPRPRCGAVRGVHEVHRQEVAAVDS